jgi:hypothetical protein
MRVDVMKGVLVDPLFKWAEQLAVCETLWRYLFDERLPTNGQRTHPDGEFHLIPFS